MAMNIFKHISAALILLVCFCAATSAQGSGKDNTFGGVVQLDRTVHDFGDILVSDGPVTATFTVKNIGDKPLLIYNVVTSCGCTDVVWTKKPINPGATGTITATFKNDEKGGYPFDKSLTAYFSGIKQPVILKLRGVTHDKKLSLEELYPVRFGALSFKKVEIKAGNLSQEQQKSGTLTVANLAGKPLTVTFSDVSEGLSVRISPNPVPARSTAKIDYTITADRNHWGKNYYFATPVVDGRQYKAVLSPSSEKESSARGAEAIVADPNPELGAGKSRIGFYAYIKENFSALTDAERNAGSNPIADESTFSFGKVKAGTSVEGVFRFTNKGKSVFRVYKVDSESSHVKALAFTDVPAGGKGELKVSLDTKGFPAGECLIVLTLTTNSPLRPIVNLYLTGWVTA
jgi:hypothetical protein